MGAELRAQIEGVKPAKFREEGREYDIRVRFQEADRALDKRFNDTQIPNVNYRMVSLNKIATGVMTSGPTTISRQDRFRYIQISADVKDGAGLGDILHETGRLLTSDPVLKMPPGVSYKFVGQAEAFQRQRWGSGNRGGGNRKGFHGRWGQWPGVMGTES